MTATAGAADPSRDPLAGPRGGAGRRGSGAQPRGSATYRAAPRRRLTPHQGGAWEGRLLSHAPEASVLAAAEPRSLHIRKLGLWPRKDLGQVTPNQTGISVLAFSPGNQALRMTASLPKSDSKFLFDVSLSQEPEGQGRGGKDLGLCSLETDNELPVLWQMPLR